MAHRLDHMGVPHYKDVTKRDGRGRVQWSGKVAVAPQHIFERPLRRRKPTMYFVNSMSDLFHENISDRTIDAVFGIMAACPQHTFQVLTKRPERAARWFERVEKRAHYAFRPRLDDSRSPGSHSTDSAWPLPNVWIGTSVESQGVIDRVAHLAFVPTAVRWISAEPLLGPLTLDLDGIDWVVVGGESGPGARPVGLGWIRSIVEQCAEARVACFVKQMGTGGDWGRREHKDPLCWPEGLRVREYPQARGV